MKLGLLHQLAFGIWAMREGSAEPYYPMVLDIIEGRTVQLATEGTPPPPPTQLQVMHDAGMTVCTEEGETLTMQDASTRLDHGARGLVVNFNITGPIAKDDGLCDIGMQTVAGWVAQFDAEPAVLGYTFNIDSPGGNGRAMLLMASALERSRKPRVGIVQYGEACSAAQGILAKMDLAFAADETDMFGSIGTYATLRDMSKALEARGIAVHNIAATKSTQKNAAVLEALKGPDHYDKFRKEYIDPFNERFVALIQKARPGVKDQNGVLEGRVLYAPEAKAEGLIDSIGETLESAVDAVRTLAKKRNNNT